MHSLNFKEQISVAMGVDFKGWDFSFLTKTGRLSEAPFAWNYNTIVQSYIKSSKKLLDMGTGGGEVLASLSPLPRDTYATESYLPNIDTAKRKLNPLGIDLIYVPENSQPPYNDRLPFDNEFFDVVINRHEAYCPKELKRILKSQGVFITQQVGFLTCANLTKDLLGSKAGYGNWNLQSAVDEVKDCGFRVVMQNEQITSERFYDIGAVVYYLKAVPWLIEDFTPEKYEKQLSNIYEIINQNGYYDTLLHRFIIVALNEK